MIRFSRRFDPHSIRLLIFDLDGTLIDSRVDLVQSVNAMLRHFELPELPGDVIASYVGDGAPVLVRRALSNVHTKKAARQVDATTQTATIAPAQNVPTPEPVDEQFFNSALEYFLGYYRLHKLDHTTVYEGIPEVLTGLAEASDGVQRLMAVLTNKPVRPSQDIVQGLGLADFFVHVYGGNSFPTKKPDPLGARTLLEETGVKASEALMIGDSAVDVLTGRNASLWTCGVTYGFAPHTLQEEGLPDVLVDAPRELGELFRPKS